MPSISSQPDRRRYRRYRSDGKAYAALDSQHPSLAHVFDISLGGISIWYVGGGIETASNDRVEIFFLDQHRRIPPLDVEVTSDSEINDTATEFYGKRRRRGFRFKNLMDVQRSAVEAFIRSHTV